MTPQKEKTGKKRENRRKETTKSSKAAQNWKQQASSVAFGQHGKGSHHQF